VTIANGLPWATDSGVSTEPLYICELPVSKPPLYMRRRAGSFESVAARVPLGRITKIVKQSSRSLPNVDLKNRISATPGRPSKSSNSGVAFNCYHLGTYVADTGRLDRTGIGSLRRTGGFSLREQVGGCAKGITWKYSTPSLPTLPMTVSAGSKTAVATVALEADAAVAAPDPTSVAAGVSTRIQHLMLAMEIRGLQESQDRVTNGWCKHLQKTTLLYCVLSI
jgi:hypothetical protein